MGRWGDPEKDAKSTLGAEAYEMARAAGYAMGLETAVAFALDDEV